MCEAYLKRWCAYRPTKLLQNILELNMFGAPSRATSASGYILVM